MEWVRLIMAMDVVYLADEDGERFEQERNAVDVVCVGDSITAGLGAR